MKNYLIISPIGDSKSFHKEWIKGNRNFDLMLINYSGVPGLHKEEADYYFEAEGFKLEIIKQAVEHFKEDIKKYSAVWLPDGDLSIKIKDIHTLFDLFNTHDLALAQPGISNWNISHFLMKQRFFSKLRYVSFVEMMCPLFRTDCLLETYTLFDFNRSGWGVDLLWSERLKEKKLAVIDAVGVKHTKAYSRKNPYYQKLKSLGIDPAAELAQIKEEFHLDRPEGPDVSKALDQRLLPGWLVPIRFLAPLLICLEERLLWRCYPRRKA